MPGTYAACLLDRVEGPQPNEKIVNEFGGLSVATLVTTTTLVSHHCHSH